MDGMSVRSAGVALLATLVALGLVGASAAAPKPKTQTQAIEQTLKVSMTKSFKKQLPGVVIGKLVCVLPKNGVVVHCTVHTSAPKNQENIVFKVTATLHDNGTISWTSTSHSCTDSKTGKPFKC